MRTLIALVVLAPLALPMVGRADVVAEVAGTAITREQLEAHVKAELVEIDSQRYEALREGLDALISEQLLAKEAASRGVTPEQVLEAEVNSKLTEPTDAQVQEVYDANKQQLGDTPLEQVKPRIVQYLKGQQEATLQQSFLDGLRKKYPTKVSLRPPVVTVGDGGRTAKGPADAPITIIEFSDYECPFCVRAEPTVKELLDAYPGKIRIVYRDFPLPMHAKAPKAAEAAHCAGDQGKYWEMHGQLFANAQKLDVPDLKDHARAIGLDAAKFDQCLDSGEKAKVVEMHKKAGEEAGVTGTPAFFINGRPLSGAQPLAAFKAIVDDELKKK